MMLRQHAFTVASLAKLWGVSTSFVYDRCQSGDLRGAFKLGGKLWRIPLATVEDYERRQQETSGWISVPAPEPEAHNIEPTSSTRQDASVARMIRLAG
jgi:excisionase family DNA binding protein